MLTSSNDFTVAVHERAFNTVIRAFQDQAPMIFNLATPDLIAAIDRASDDPDTLDALLCDREPLRRNEARDAPWPVTALFTPVGYLPIPGYDGDRGISFILQITGLSFDFYPNNSIDLPPELSGRFEEQQLGLQLKLCAGIARPIDEDQDALLDGLPPPEPFDPDTFGARFESFELSGPRHVPTKPFVTEGVDCFSLEVDSLARFVRRPKLADHDENLEYLSIELADVEIVSTTSARLESSLEGLIYLTLQFGLLPKLRTLVRDLAIARGPFGVRLAPTTGDIPFNPSVVDDELRIFLDVSLVA
jgi:hypothetical protein